MVNTVPFVKLNNEIMMPQFGLGVYKANEGEEVENAVATALRAGYRLIDTATIYRNEKGVGKAIAASGVPREELFITTKLWNDDQGYDSTLLAFDKSLDMLSLDYIDLYLIHWPKTGTYKETWKAFEKLHADKKIRAIGVSNFKPRHLEELLKTANVVPAVNQIELHPMMTQLETRQYCKEKSIKIESWSPLMRAGELFKNKIITSIAANHNKEPAQVVLRWHIQSDLIVIPKSVTPERIRSNIDIFSFELTAYEMKQIDGLNQDIRIGPDPDTF